MDKHWFIPSNFFQLFYIHLSFEKLPFGLPERFWPSKLPSKLPFFLSGFLLSPKASFQALFFSTRSFLPSFSSSFQKLPSKLSSFPPSFLPSLLSGFHLLPPFLPTYLPSLLPSFHQLSPTPTFFLAWLLPGPSSTMTTTRAQSTDNLNHILLNVAGVPKSNKINLSFTYEGIDGLLDFLALAPNQWYWWFGVQNAQ